jgi:hypothetical protein
LKPIFAALGAFLLNPWLALTFKTMQLGLDAQNVIALRMLRFATGDARAPNEVRRMVAETTEAAADIQGTAISATITGHKDATGAGKVLGVLKKRVRAKKRRLRR